MIISFKKNSKIVLQYCKGNPAMKYLLNIHATTWCTTSLVPSSVHSFGVSSWYQQGFMMAEVLFSAVS